MVDEQPLHALEHEMSVLVRRLRRVILERARMVHPDLSPVSYSMLAALNDNGPMRASDLVGMFSIDKGAVSRHVQALLELELITRTPDPDDRRAAILHTTEEGIRRLAAVSAARRVELSKRLADWSEDDVDSFVRLLGRYNATLE